MARVVLGPIRRVRLRALTGVHFAADWKLFGSPIVQRYRGSTISLGRRGTLRSTLLSNPLSPTHPVVLSTRSPLATLRIGDDFGMTGGSVVAALSVDIGDRVLVGANSTITDTDFHPVQPEARGSSTQEAESAAVLIGDDVFIGMNCLILKGVTIGSGSVIGAGSVVTADIPERTIAAGNPARAIGRVPADAEA